MYQFFKILESFFCYIYITNFKTSIIFTLLANNKSNIKNSFI